jgi:hypothetical protein
VARVDDDEVLDIREAATLLGVGEEVVIQEAANGNLPGRRIVGSGGSLVRICLDGCG